jgi:hypothetical protein
MEIVDGRPRLEARTESGVELRIGCDRLSLQSPGGDIEAGGNVSISAGSLEATCDRLVLTWRDSRITRAGKVQLKGRHDEQTVELTADGVSMKLTPSGKTKNEGNAPKALLASPPASPSPVARPPAAEPPAPSPASSPNPAPINPEGLLPGMSRRAPGGLPPPVVRETPSFQGSTPPAVREQRETPAYGSR